MEEIAKTHKFGAFLLYALSITGAIVGFLLIQSWGRNLSAPAPTGAIGGAAQSAAHAHAGELLHVLLALVAVVAMARILGTVFRLFRQPPVIGEIIAGIMLGPSLLGRVAPEAYAYLFPSSVTPPLSIIAQVGVILFMFLIGVELNLGALRERGHATIAISHASIIAPFFLGALLSLFLYPRLSSSAVPFTNFALFIGVALSITAFPVLARILTDRRISKSRMGAIALTCAAVDDLTAWCLLAFVVGVARAERTGVVKTVALALAYIAIMGFVIRPLMRRLAVHYGNRGRLTQGLMAIVVVLLLLSASATELIGIHAIFGAFALGALIPHDSGLARELVDRLEDFVVVLLLPAFFAFTGLHTQIGLLNTPAQWMLCALIIVTASIGKFGGTLVAARLTGLGWRDGTALGVLMNTRGLMQFIVLDIGFELHIISPVLFAMMVLMALVTTFATTPILHLIMRDEGQDAEPIRRTAVAHDVRRSAILVPVANPNGVERLINLALAATPANTPPPRVLAMVRRPAGGVRASLGDDEAHIIPRSAALSAALELAWRRGTVITPQAMWSDDPAADLIKLATDAGIEWILLGPHRSVFGADYRGGVVRTILERARALPLSVAVAIEGADASFDRLFAVADSSPDGRAVLELAARLIQGTDATLQVIRVADADEARIAHPVTDLLAEIAQLAGRRLHTETIADPTLAMIAERTQPGLVIMGASIADRLGLARRGFPDRRAMILVQGSHLLSVAGAGEAALPDSAAG
jgi:Kef-type K+ transport system membrane component KefB